MTVPLGPESMLVSGSVVSAALVCTTSWGGLASSRDSNTTPSEESGTRVKEYVPLVVTADVSSYSVVPTGAEPMSATSFGPVLGLVSQVTVPSSHVMSEENTLGPLPEPLVVLKRSFAEVTSRPAPIPPTWNFTRACLTGLVSDLR